MDIMDIMENKTDNIFDADTNDQPVIKDTRAPYRVWVVNGKEYKLKLTATVIRKLEQGFGSSLLTAVMEDGIPPIDTIATLLQGAMQKYHHGIKSYAVDELIDDYMDNGGTHITLLQDVIYPLLHDAGFFTKAQMTLLTKEMDSMDSAL